MSLKEFFFDYSIQKAICTSLITREEDNNERMYKNILVPFGFFSFFLKLMDETFTFLYKSDAISCIDNNKGFVVLNLLP